MAIKLVNTFQPSSPVAQAMSNLIASYAPDSAGEIADREVKASTTALNRQKFNAPTQLQAIIDSVYNAQPTVAEAPRVNPDTIGPMPPVSTPPDYQALARSKLGELASAAFAAGETDLGKVFRPFIANTPGVAPEAIDRAMLGAGDAYSNTIGGFREGEQGKMDRTKYVIDNKPVSVAAGATLFTPQGNSLAQGRTTKTVAEGEALQNLPMADRQALLDQGGWTIGPDGKPVMTPGGRLTKPMQTKMQESIVATDEFNTVADKLLADAAANPTSLGAVGQARGLWQDVVGQANLLKQALGENSPDILNTITSQKQTYDPTLATIPQAMESLAFMAAKSVFDQTGQGLSDNDRRIVANIVGRASDPTMTVEKLNALVGELKTWQRGKLDAYGSMAGRSITHPAQVLDPTIDENFDSGGGGGSDGGITIDIDGNIIQ